MKEYVNIYEMRRKKYQRFLFFALILGVCGVLLSLYVQMWEKVPSTIMIRAGMEQRLSFGVPVRGELYHEAMEASNTMHGERRHKSLPINLQKPITFRANQIDRYKLDLKVFGVLPFKEVDVQVIQDAVLKPAGIPIGIYVETKGVMVIGIGEFENETGQKVRPAEHILQPGDYICSVNEQEVTDKKTLIDFISHSEGGAMVFAIRRAGQELQVRAMPEQNENGEYKMGIWVRDNAQGVGTMTFVDEHGKFGALGHGINDVDTSSLMELGKGNLYHTEIIGITRGSKGNPGELTGYIEYDEQNVMGSITRNTGCGIFGVCSENVTSALPHEYMTLGLKQEIELGEAQILCCVEEETKLYDVEIVEIHLENKNLNRGIVIEITDPDLLSVTGGIVQGMSGSPIIQNGKLIGAVTHVLVNDPTKGYGIFAETMLEQAY